MQPIRKTTASSADKEVPGSTLIEMARTVCGAHQTVKYARFGDENLPIVDFEGLLELQDYVQEQTATGAK